MELFILMCIYYSLIVVAEATAAAIVMAFVRMADFQQ